MKSYLLAMLVLPLLMLAWLFVQNAWRRAFSSTDADGDVLAGRSNCGQCECATPCDRRMNKETSERGIYHEPRRL